MEFPRCIDFDQAREVLRAADALDALVAKLDSLGLIDAYSTPELIDAIDAATRPRRRTPRSHRSIPAKRPTS